MCQRAEKPLFRTSLSSLSKYPSSQACSEQWNRLRCTCAVDGEALGGRAERCVLRQNPAAKGRADR